MFSKCEKWLEEIENVFDGYKHIKTIEASVKDITAENIIIHNCCSKNPYASFTKALTIWTDESKKKGMGLNLVFLYNCNTNHSSDVIKNMALELQRAYFDFTI
jgi:hypothetical protein